MAASSMQETWHTISEAEHHRVVEATYRHRGYTAEEAAAASQACANATRHGIRTHNAIKALHLDQDFGAAAGGCVPGVAVEELPCRFAASRIWDAKRKLGQPVAMDAMRTAMALADEFGIGQVSVDNAFHYLWGGGYVMEAARAGYIAYTNCTSTLAEVVPFKGRVPTLGTNPHSWGLPTMEAIGFPLVIDWATSVLSMGRVEQFKREGNALPLNAAVDTAGEPTEDPHAVGALLPFGAHKGYGLCLYNELLAALIGGSLPTLRGRPQLAPDDEKTTSAFYFQVIHPEAISGGAFAQGRDQSANLKAVIDNILDGNDDAILPGQIEADAAARCAEAGGLLFSTAELAALNELADECGEPPLDP